MSDEPALLAAILAHPDEDTPRLIYADWLDENARPERAEFIRIQCAPDADEAAEERAFELEERNRGKWLAGLPQFAGAGWEFRRGFPECLHAPGELFLERYEAFARVPWLRFLSLRELVDLEVRNFVNLPWNAQWVELELQMLDGHFLNERYAFYDARGVIALANSPQVKQLKRLQLTLVTLNAEAVHALAISPNLNDIRTLWVPDQGDASLLEPLRERFGDRLVIG